MQNLFAYGTLMCEEIMMEVSGCRPPFLSAGLNGFVRRKVKGEFYPGICPDDQGNVEGIVYLNVPPEAWNRLDSFEGGMYERRTVKIGFDFESFLFAQTYVVKPEYQDMLEAVDWNYETFLKYGKESFRRHYKGYGALDQTQLRQGFRPD